MTTKVKPKAMTKTRKPTAHKEVRRSFTIVKDPKSGEFIALNREGKVVTNKSASPAAQEKALSRKLISEIETGNPDVATLCERYHLKREELGRLTGFSLRALAEWSAGKLPSAPAKRRLHETRRLLDALSQIVKPQFIPEWLHRPNVAFNNMTPLQTIELGEIDRLWTMVHQMG